MSPPPPGPPSPPPSAPLRPRAAAGDQEPGPPRTAPARRHHRPPGRDRGARPVSAARLLQPVRLRGARARLQRRGRRSAHRRHAAVRRSTGRAGGGARRLADAERRRRVAVGVRPAAAPRVDLPRRGDRTGRDASARLRAGRTVLRRAGAAAAGARCGGAAEAGASRGGRRREEAAGKSARQVRQMLADLDPELAPPADRVRPLGDGRYELKAVIDADCQQGLEQLRGLLSHVDPRMTIGLLVGRLVKEGLDRHDPSRPPRRARSGSRPADAKATAPRTPTSEQAQRNSAPAAKHAARPAIPAGAATTPARAVRPTPISAPQPSTQEETARRAATGAKPTSAATPASKSCASGRAISAAVRRHVWQRDGGRLQLRRSTDRAPLQLNASDRDRPHRPACAGRRRRSSQPQTSVWRAHHRHRHAQGRSSREPAP